MEGASDVGLDRTDEDIARPMRKKEEARKKTRMAIRGGRMVGDGRARRG